MLSSYTAFYLRGLWTFRYHNFSTPYYLVCLCQTESKVWGPVRSPPCSTGAWPGFPGFLCDQLQLATQWNTHWQEEMHSFVPIPPTGHSAGHLLIVVLGSIEHAVLTSGNNSQYVIYNLPFTFMLISFIMVIFIMLLLRHSPSSKLPYLPRPGS